MSVSGLTAVGAMLNTPLQRSTQTALIQTSTGLLDNQQNTIRYGITPKRKALLNTIRYAEGTWRTGKNLGYRTLYGGEKFDDFSKHPEKVITKLISLDNAFKCL